MARVMADLTLDAHAAETVAKLRAIQALIEAASISADTLEGGDNLNKRELHDSLAVAQLSVLRMLEDEGYGGNVSFFST